MQEHIRSIRNWHYVLVLLSLAGLTLALEVSRAQQMKVLVKDYNRFHVQPGIRLGADVYDDSVRVAMKRYQPNINDDNPMADRVRHFMDDFYKSYLAQVLNEDSVHLPREGWMFDKDYTNEILLAYAASLERYFFSAPPYAGPFADSLFAFINRHPEVPFVTPSDTAYRIKRTVASSVESSLIRIAVAEPGSLPDSGSIVVPASYQPWISVAAIRPAITMYGLRGTGTWRDIRGMNYWDTKVLLNEQLQDGTMTLPIVNIGVRKSYAVSMFILSALLVALLMRLNLKNAILLFSFPNKVNDLDAAFTSAYVGTSTNKVAIVLNHLLLVLLPSAVMASLAWFTVLGAEWYTSLFVVLSCLAFVLVAQGVHKDLVRLARHAEAHWKKDDEVRSVTP